MNIEAYRDLLLSKIKTAKLVSGGTTIACRCFYCPDGKSLNSKHFYISIPPDNQTPSLYYCHKCHASGVVDYKKLIEWDIYDDNISVALTEHNKRCAISGKNKIYYNNSIAMLRYYHVTDSESARIKANYINTRLGTNLTYNDFIRLKIVINIEDIITDTYLYQQPVLTRDANIVNQINNNFIGFITVDNKVVNCRRVCEEGLVYKSIDKRYINYNLYSGFQNSVNYYAIPATISGVPNERINIHIAEGAFDILSIYFNLRHCEQGIYSSVGGGNYIAPIMYYLERFGLSYCEIHIYPDNDNVGSDTVMNKIANYLRPMRIPLYVHRNLCEGQKDFGVPLNCIKEYISEVR